LSQITEDQIWNDPKPYVIYGVFFINACQLTIPAGAKIYVHGGLVKNKNISDGAFNDGIIYAVNGGVLKINGTEAKPVVIQSDRLEKEFEDTPGQWGAIVLGKNSTGNVVNHAIIKNSIVGIRVDSNSELTIKNTKIYNTSGSGLVAVHAKVSAQNCLFRRNYGTSVGLSFGGYYDFDYCTMANYGADASALYLGNRACLRQDASGACIQAAKNDLHAKFRNCIVFGGRPDEIDLDQEKTAAFDVQFEHCVIRVKEILKPTGYPKFLTDNCTKCINGTGTTVLFRRDNLTLKNNTKLIGILEDYHLDTLSVADGVGKVLPGIDKDLDGVTRNTTNPDIGCYERLR
jgi:nitroimidazol reductase NimA-like FMN-containing flavoprotein (pyridoxamine 5'-phosphate oxidase superfamily)